MLDIILMLLYCFISLLFLLMTLLATYFVYILDYGNDVRQNANSTDFLI